jgi:hypothetical protein
MGLPARERPGLGERYGIAVNASRLEIEVGHDAALDRICEMAYARIGMSAAAEGASDAMASELAPWLWRAAYGRDRGTAVGKACSGFSSWLMLRPYFAEIDMVDRGIVQRFAQAVVHEWLTLRCQACGGSGWEEITARGQRARPSGRSRNAPKAICSRCRGSGKPKPAHKLRIRVLSSTHRKVGDGEYEKLWRRQFSLGHAWLKKISERPRDHLHAIRSSE